MYALPVTDSAQCSPHPNQVCSFRVFRCLPLSKDIPFYGLFEKLFCSFTLKSLVTLKIALENLDIANTGDGHVSILSNASRNGALILLVQSISILEKNEFISRLNYE